MINYFLFMDIDNIGCALSIYETTNKLRRHFAKSTPCVKKRFDWIVTFSLSVKVVKVNNWERHTTKWYITTDDWQQVPCGIISTEKSFYSKDAGSQITPDVRNFNYLSAHFTSQIILQTNL